MTLDIKTLMLLNFIINFVNVFVLAIIWRSYRKHFAGLFFLLFDMILQTLGFILSLLRGVLPALISIVLANSLLMIGALLVLIGLERFFNIKKKHSHNYIIIVVFVCLLTYFGLFQPNLTAREISISAVIILINAQSCWLLFHRVDLNSRRIARFTGVILLLYIFVSFFRIISLVAFPIQTNDFFKSDLSDSIAITLYLVLSTLITMSFILLVSRRLLAEVQIEKEKYNTTFNSSPYAIILTRMADGRIFEVNEGFVKITGYQPIDVMGKTTIEINLWDRESDRLTVVNELSKGNDVHDLEMQFRSKNGCIIKGLLSSKLIDANNEKSIITSVSDITEMSKIRQELHDLAMHDFLTGLPNRKLFFDRFEIAKTNAQRENYGIAILSMDIDRLKSVNDQFGHDAGDQVLVAVSNRLTGLLRKDDTVARFGGDEFLLLLLGIHSRNDASKIIEKIQERLLEPININPHIIEISTSIGVTLFPEDGLDINTLIRKSDEAMYHVKANGRNNHQYYDEQK